MREPDILFEDDSVLVINKPAGLIVHSDGRTVEPSVADWVVARYPQMAGVGEPWTSPQGTVVDRPGIVHRLDRTTSGVMVLAKTPEAHAFLKEQFQTRTVQKEYVALVYGHPKGDSGIIEAEIRRTRSMPPRWTAEPGSAKKRAAVTKWEVLKRGQLDGHEVSFLKLEPKTGRTHQLRVHLKFFKHPVVCDHLYAEGQPCIAGLTRPALHAERLTLTLPSGERRTFAAPLPADLQFAKTL